MTYHSKFILNQICFNFDQYKFIEKEPSIYNIKLVLKIFMDYVSGVFIYLILYILKDFSKNLIKVE
jgi:hypothetical protein